jgi:SsrA-binding protein
MNKIIAKNPTAYHNYNITDKIEAGIVLSGTEIKSIRNGKVNLKDTYVNIKNGEVFVYGMHISPYEFGNRNNVDPLRTRKLLLNRREIDKLYGMIKQKSVSVVPISMYFSFPLLSFPLPYTVIWSTAPVFTSVLRTQHLVCLKIKEC